MRPITHLLFAYITAALVTKDVRYRRLICVLGILPDLDGIWILFDTELYQRYHHVLLHSLPAGILISVSLTLLWILYHNRVRPLKDVEPILPKKAFLFGMIGFIVHITADIIGTNWPVYWLYPLSGHGLSVYPMLSDYVIYDIINPVADTASLIFLLLVMLKERRTPIQLLYEGLEFREELMFIGFTILMFFGWGIIFDVLGVDGVGG